DEDAAKNIVGFTTYEELKKYDPSTSDSAYKWTVTDNGLSALHYYEEDNMPQTNLCRDLEGGMAIHAGRLREDTQYDYKFVCLSHNTLRGAAGGAVLLAELLCAKGFMD
ncbi:MAG: hypothetical protein U0K93_04975, partial [Acutalibacteraceae bacterium]|nr:hypothetical protein [Acutalibacteraceae bacterium]